MSMLIRIICLVIFLLVCREIRPTAGQGGTTFNDCAEVLEDITTYTIKGYAKPKYSVKRRIRIHREEGDQYGKAWIHESGLIKLKSFAGKIIDASGEVIYTCNKNDGEKFCGFSDYALYDDVCARRYTLTSNRYPYTIEYEYLLEHKSLYFMPNWQPRWDIPVSLSEYRLVIPDDMAIDWRSIGNIPQPDMTEKKGYRHYHWHLTDVPAYKSEEYMVIDAGQGMAIQFAPQTLKLGKYTLDATDWSTLSRTLYGLFEDKMKLAAAQEMMVNNTFIGPQPTRENIQHLHEALADRTRYVAIQIGIGGWEPSASTETFKRGYGDCKDLSTMYVSMLSEGGIQTRCALITRRGHNAADPQVPRPHFNHAILMSIITGDTIWIDPTCQECTVGDLPWDDENRYALILDPQAGDLVRTPASHAAENQITRTAHLTLDDDAQAHAQIIFTMEGNPSHLLKSTLRHANPADVHRLLQTNLFGLTPSFTVDSYSVPENKLGRSSLTVQVQGASATNSRAVGDEFYLNFDWLSLLREQERISFKHRKFGIDLRYPMSIVDTIIVQLPEFMKIVKLPEDVTISDDFGSLSLHYHVKDRQLTVIRERKTNLYHVFPNDFERYQQSIKEVVRLINQFVIISKSE